MTAPTTVLAVLDRLAAWAEDEGAWCSGSFARDAGGEAVQLDDPRAARYCSWGKLMDLADEGDDFVAYRAVRDRLNVESRRMGYRNLADCNDQGGLPAVRAMIARAREEAAKDG